MADLDTTRVALNKTANELDGAWSEITALRRLLDETGVRCEDILERHSPSRKVEMKLREIIESLPPRLPPPDISSGGQPGSGTAGLRPLDLNKIRDQLDQTIVALPKK